MRMKEAYAQKLQVQLDNWGMDICRLKAQADEAEAEAKLEYYKQVEELRALQTAARDKLKELQTAGDDSWEELKAGIEIAWDSLGHALKSATERFK